MTAYRNSYVQMDGRTYRVAFATAGDRPMIVIRQKHRPGMRGSDALDWIDTKQAIKLDGKLAERVIAKARRERAQ